MRAVLELHGSEPTEGIASGIAVSSKILSGVWAQALNLCVRLSASSCGRPVVALFGRPVVVLWSYAVADKTLFDYYRRAAGPDSTRDTADEQPPPPPAPPGQLGPVTLRRLPSTDSVGSNLSVNSSLLDIFADSGALSCDELKFSFNRKGNDDDDTPGAASALVSRTLSQFVSKAAASVFELERTRDHVADTLQKCDKAIRQGLKSKDPATRTLLLRLRRTLSTAPSFLRRFNSGQKTLKRSLEGLSCAANKRACIACTATQLEGLQSVNELACSGLPSF